MRPVEALRSSITDQTASHHDRFSRAGPRYHRLQILHRDKCTCPRARFPGPATAAAEASNPSRSAAGPTQCSAVIRVTVLAWHRDPSPSRAPARFFGPQNTAFIRLQVPPCQTIHEGIHQRVREKK